MRIAQINGGVFGSTGKIMFGIAEVAKDNGIETRCFAPVTSTNRKKEPPYPYEKIGSFWQRRFSVLLSRITGLDGCFSYFATKRLLKKITKFQPNIVHLHNLHGSYIHLPSLFSYLKKKEIKVVWTLHDCWAFTGHCAYFTIAKCEKWKDVCRRCPQKREYPKSLFDNSKKMYGLKKKWFLGVKDMTIVTPSQWLARLVKQSFLKEYPVEVVPNGIDLSIFKPRQSDFREKYGIKEEFLLLGVSFGWGKRKGLDVFVELSKRLDENYKIVLVGTDEEVDKLLPKNILSIHRTQNQEELAGIYTAADLFVNPTREEVLGMVNVESLACGTPVVTFKTGGSPECIDETCGSVVTCDDITALQMEIERIRIEQPYSKESCLSRAKVFEQRNRFYTFMDLYRK